MKKILLVFAHPDDESFTTAGTVAKYVRAGWNVDLLCATRGEAGSRGPYIDFSESLGSIRQKELEAAARIVGIRNTIFLGYKDRKVSLLHPGELEDVVFRTMRELRPDIVITFEPNGISNHPDHMKLTRSTTYAFQKYASMRGQEQNPQLPNRSRVQKYRAASWAQAGEVMSGTTEPKLYYVCMPESLADYLKRTKSIPRESFGKPWRGTPDRFITTVIDIRRFGTMKARALRTHVSQRDDVERMLRLAHHPMLQQEHFVLRMHGVHEVFMGKNDRIANRL